MVKITDVHIRRLFKHLGQGQSLTEAAGRAGVDRRTARRYWIMKRLPSEMPEVPRTWRTRPDPLADVWPEVAEQLAQAPRLQAKTLWDWLQRKYPGRFAEGQLRTLQRRVKEWRATEGPGQEVYFSQEHHPGQLGASDFTHMGSLNVTIAGQPFDHLVYHFVLTYSNWESVTICFSESFESLSEGLQNALWELGGVPERHRSDRMSAAVNNLSERREFTERYESLLGHYGVTGEKINARAAHENGDAESSHRHFKEAVDQALLLRGQRDFASREQYAAFLEEVRRQRNAGRAPRFVEEQALLGALPSKRRETYKRLDVTVTSGSLIHVQNNVYTVNSRLIGERVEVRIHPEHVQVWYGQKVVETLPRLRGRRQQHIDYRHVIDTLVRKPGALANYRYRAELFPTSRFRLAYDWLHETSPTRADREYLEILYLAAHESEAGVDQALRRLIERERPINSAAVKTLLKEGQEALVLTEVIVAPVDLAGFDTLLTEVWHEPEQRCAGPLGGVLEGVAFAFDADELRGAGPACGEGDAFLRTLSAGAEPAGVRDAAGAPDRAAAASVADRGGQGPAQLRPETLAGESGSPGTHALGGFIPGSPGECSGVRSQWFREDASVVGVGPGADSCGPPRVLLHVQPVGARVVGGQARLETEQGPETTRCLRRTDHRRYWIRAAEPRGDGGAVHAAGRSLRTRQRAPDQQPAVLEVGDDLQGPNDHGRRHRPARAPQRHLGIEHPELPARTGQESHRTGGRRRGQAHWRPAAAGTGRPREPWALLIVAQGRG